MAVLKKSGLGQGLGDLFARTDDDKAEQLSDGSTFADLPLQQISPNPHQPRTVFDEDELADAGFDYVADEEVDASFDDDGDDEF